MQRVETRIELELPDWLEGALSAWPQRASAEQRMAALIALARENVEAGTGGPFSAAVVDARDGALVSVGVNIVEASGASIAHAEVMALALAQKSVGSFDLGAGGIRRELWTSAAPCAMCLGASCWSGITRVVCAARGEDVESIGFDEGPVPEDWAGALRERGIEVERDLMRAEAVQVLRAYGDRGGRIYNAQRTSPPRR
jgi:tRNA(Arg) A34 adenosine deaminase TadA